MLIVDSVFALRREFNDTRNYRIWLDVDARLCLARSVARNAEREEIDGALALHRERYQVAERIYLGEVNPRLLADLIIYNTDFANSFGCGSLEGSNHNSVQALGSGGSIGSRHECDGGERHLDGDTPLDDALLG